MVRECRGSCGSGNGLALSMTRSVRMMEPGYCAVGIIGFEHSQDNLRYRPLTDD
jgi:hypothetical protein